MRKNIKFMSYYISLIFLSLGISTIGHCETIYFLVAEDNPFHNDSYVLPLTEPNDIAHARDLIEFGPGIGNAIVVAEIECGMDGINRNYLSSYKTLWSWHVTSFVDFASAVIEILDGWPGGVQENCQGWIDNTGGLIGFCHYTIVAELGTDPFGWRCDFVLDGEINNKDFVKFATNWLRNDCNSPGWCNKADLNHSGSVDLQDLYIFLDNWLDPFAQQPLWFDCWNIPTQCHGDGNGSGKVDTADLLLLKAAYPLPVYYGGPRYNACIDFDRDADVDGNDVDILTASFGKTVPGDCPSGP